MMIDLGKRALPLMFGLAISFSPVILFRPVLNLTPLQSAFSGEIYQADIPEVPLSHLTLKERMAIIEHKTGGLCHSHSKTIDVIGTVIHNQVMTKAKILYMPKPGSWETQKICTYCLVMLSVTLEASGKVTNIVPRYIDSHEEAVDVGTQCEKDVLAAVEQVRFKPAMKNGKPVSQIVTIIYDKWGYEVKDR
jgi:hypothetical protein